MYGTIPIKELKAESRARKLRIKEARAKSWAYAIEKKEVNITQLTSTLLTFGTALSGSFA